MSVDLLRALRATCGSRMAFVGSGGKTTAIFQLAHCFSNNSVWITTVSYTHLRAHETVLDLVCRLLLEKKKKKKK